MEIKRVAIGGNREEINKETGEHRPNFIETVKRSDLIFTPNQMVEKLFRGTPQEYDSWLMKHKLHPSQINYHDINQKQELLKILKSYTMRLLEEAKTDSMFSNALGNLVVTKWLDSFDTLENHVFDLGDFNRVEFMKIADEFKRRYTTNSPFAFLTIDDVNQQIKVVESHKVLLLLDKKLPMGKKRGTPVGQQPEKLYQNFFTAIGYKGKGELTEGLNHHRTNFRNFNFNLNIETRLLNDIIYDTLGYDRGQTQVAFIFGVYGKKLYFESDIKGTERKQEELEALAIADEATSVISKELHKERQGSIAIDKTTLEVENRIAHPKISENRIEEEKKGEPIVVEIEEPTQNLSNSLETFEKEIFIKQQGYAELAKEKINEALTNRNQYINEFQSFLKKGMNVSDALNKFSERYANNPYIKGIIETSITGELQLQALKDRGIEELNYTIAVLKSEKLGLQKDLDVKETEIASLNQNMESLVVQHTKQLEEIEVSVAKLVEERTSLIESSNRQLEMIGELEKLIGQYEQTLRAKDAKIDKLERVNASLVESSREVDSLERENRNLSRKVENYDSEIKYYGRQIEQLKEENRLILSATNLLKTNNAQLESQNEALLKELAQLKDR